MIRDTDITKDYMTYKEIGEILGVSHTRARQITEGALKKLSHSKNRTRWERLREILGDIEEERARRDMAYEELRGDLEWSK